ncbi:MAG: ComEA family DNA-binding protein [Bacteroidota bacterium]|jgi:competence protein ComEA
MRGYAQKIRTFFQSVCGISKGEFLVLSMLVSGGMLGILIKFIQPHSLMEDHSLQSAEMFNHILDSLSYAEQSTFTGIDDSGNPLTELARADTIVKKQGAFPSASHAKVSAGQIIDIQKASKNDLMKLPGIGEATAERIIEYREQEGFDKIEDIMNVKGIGTKKYDKMRAHISLTKSK